MKKLFSLVSFAFVMILIQSCSNKEISRPVTASQNSNAVADQNAALTKLAPGNYTVKLYVENGDTSTVEFIDYVFTFKANGTLLATADSITYKGKWESKNNSTQLKLDIEGTDALKDVDKGWDIVKITNVQISLKDNQGQFGDKLVFVKVK